MASGYREFQLDKYPFCGCQMDTKKDCYLDFDRKYGPGVFPLYRCHNCHTLYEVLPVVIGYRARMLEKG